MYHIYLYSLTAGHLVSSVGIDLVTPITFMPKQLHLSATEKQYSIQEYRVTIWFNSLPTGKFFMVCYHLLIFKKKTHSEIPSVTKSLDPDHAWQFVMPYLGPNCLQSLSAEDK